MFFTTLRLGVVLLAVVSSSTVDAAEVFRLDFENEFDLTEETSGSGFLGIISQLNFGGSITQSPDVPIGSSGTGSAFFSQLDFENGLFIEFLDDQFPNFTPDDSFTVSLWAKPSFAFVTDGWGFRSIIASNTATGIADWQVDNGENVDNGLGDGTLTGARLHSPPTTDLIPDGDLVAEQWTQISIAFLGPARAGVVFVGDESMPLAFSSAASGGDGYAAEDLIIGANRNKVKLYDGLLDDVRVFDTAILHDGAGGEFQPGDLDFSGGNPDVGDWLAFRGGQGADLSAETPLGAYGRGDVDFDGDNDLADFVAFRTFYNEANGTGALEALIGVPEPSAALLALLLAGGWFGYRRRFGQRVDADSPQPDIAPTNLASMNLSRLRLFTLAVILPLAAGNSAFAQEALFDFGNGDFSANNATPDGLANFVIPDGTALGTLTNTQNGVEITLTGITTDTPGTYDSNSQGFGIVSANETGGAAAQRRLDAANDGETVQFSFDSTVNLVSLRVGSLSSADEGFVISFISGDDPFGGGDFTYTTSDDGATEGPDYDIPLGNISATAGTVFEFSTINEGGGGILWNGLNTFIGTPPEPLTLQVDTGTGALNLLNNSTDPIEVDYLRFVSADEELDGGSLAPGSYTGLAGAPGFPAGNDDGSGWEAADSNDEFEIIESFLTGSSPIPNDGVPINLGNAFVPGATEDISFSYHVTGTPADGVAGQIEYISSGLPGDFDSDGDVDGADFLVWQRGESPGGATAGDLALWQANFGVSLIGAATAAAVPEPATFTLCVVCAGLLAVLRRNRVKWQSC